MNTTTRSQPERAAYPRVLVFASIALVSAALVLPGREGRSGAAVSKGPTRAAAPSHGPNVTFFSEQWMRQEGIPVYTDWAMDAENAVLAPWPRLGARGAYVRLYGQQGVLNAYVLEIAPGQGTFPEHHVFEEYFVVLRGHGKMRVWKDGVEPAEIEWGPNTVLSPPMNASHQNVNLGDAPALLVGITNAPRILDYFRDPAFVFENPARFDDRWDGHPGYFAKVPRPRGPGEPVGARQQVNVVPDALALGPQMYRWEEKDGLFAAFSMCGNILSPHVSAWGPQSFETAHRHGPGSTFVVLAGEGFALMWPETAGPRPWQDGHADTVVRTDLRRGMIYSPAANWYHTHFNVAPVGATYVAVTPRGSGPTVQAIPEPGNYPEVEQMEDSAHADLPLLISRDAEDPMMRRLMKAGVERARSSLPAPAPRVP